MAGMKGTRDENFVRRLAECWGSELSPEMITPMSAGAEELPDYVETMPVVKQFKQTNMGRPPYSRNTRSWKNNREE